jgi:glutathione S-transferase
MMKLYYVPGACSLASNIALREAGLPFQLELVDLQRGKRLPDGRDYAEVTPKAYVPALELDDGELLTEGAVILAYIADRRPGAALAPASGSWARVRLQETLHFIATELHKGLTPLFLPICPADVAQQTRERFAARLALIAAQLGERPYLFERFTIADVYLFYVLRTWSRFLKGEVPDNLAAYYRALADRPSVREALASEHLAP